MKHGDRLSQDSALTALNAAIFWADPPVLGISVAAFIDNNAIDDSALVNYLAARERDKARLITDSVEKRHFILRRCFQRIFVKTMLNWQHELSELSIEHQLDTQPRCLDAPDLRLSFSSSGFTAVACASSQFTVGVDIEKQRTIVNLAALTERFFSLFEAQSIAALPVCDQNVAFLKHWTAKEAGLKAIGKGIVSGLNSFVLKSQNNIYNIDFVNEFKNSTTWRVNYLNFVPDHIVAVVHNLEK